MNFSELLFDSSKFLAIKITNQLLENSKYLKTAFETVYCEIPQISSRTTYVIERYDRVRSEDIILYYDEIIENLLKIKIDGIKRSLLKIFTRRVDLLNEEQTGKLIDICFYFLNNNNQSIATKMYSMEILFYMTKKFPELKNEFVATIELGYTNATPAYKSRAKQYTKKIQFKKF